MNKITWAAGNGLNDSVANLKAWLQALHDNLIAAGLVQTADTGQLSISAISATLIAGSYLAPLLYRFDDAEAASSPIIIKIRPFAGCFGSSSAFGGVAVTVGRATDGAGNITGVNTGEFNFYNSSNGAVGSLPRLSSQSYVIHSNGRFSMLLGVGWTSSDVNSFCMLFLDINRTAGGIIITSNASPYDPGNIVSHASMRIRKARLDTIFRGWRQDLCYWAGGADAPTAGGAVQMQRTYRLAPDLEADPSLALYWASSVTTGDQFALSVDGVSRNYIAVGNATCLVVDPITNTNVVGVALLWGDL